MLTSRDLASRNPLDIASIKVLKGTDAAIYGMNGAHGVSVIKMKSCRLGIAVASSQINQNGGRYA